MSDISVKEKVDDIFAKRSEFFALLDELVQKQEGTDIFNFEVAKMANLKEIYTKFYAYDYSVRKLMPDVYKAYNIK